MDSPEIGSNALTAVAIFLPLSSLWASASLDSRFGELKAQNFSPKIIPSYATRSSGLMEEGKDAKGPLSPSNTDSTRMSAISANALHGNGQMMHQDLEAQGLTGAEKSVGKNRR